MGRKRPDMYYKRAKKEGYRSRAAYKLEQMQRKFKIFQKGQTIVDLCGAPGGWSQIASEEIGDDGRVILVDLESVHDLGKISSIIADITSPNVVEQIHMMITEPKRVDVVLADCSPNVIGQWDTDHARQIWLSENALHIAIQLEANTFVCKVFQGNSLRKFVIEVKKYFPHTDLHKPQASRRQSAEIYMICRK